MYVAMQVIFPMLYPDFSPKCSGRTVEMDVRLLGAAASGGFPERKAVLTMVPEERVAIFSGLIFWILGLGYIGSLT